MKKKKIDKVRRPHEVPEDHPLTELEDVFVDEYLVDLNGTKAYMRVRNGDITVKAAQVAASRALQQPNVIKVLAERRELKRKRAEIRQDDVLKQLRIKAFANMGDYASWGEQRVTLKDSKGLSEDQKAGVKKVNESKYGVSIELFDQVKCIELLMKHLGMLKEKHEHSGPDGKPIGFEAAYQQAAESILDEVNGAACGLPMPVGNRPTTELEKK